MKMTRRAIAGAVSMAAVAAATTVVAVSAATESRSAEATGDSPLLAQTSTIDWNVTAENLRGQNNQTFSFDCLSNGFPGIIWGNNIYTDHSSICTAAVHAGVISETSGGPVSIQIRAGRNSYSGATRNGILSNSFGSWSGSYVFVSGGSSPSTSPGNGRPGSGGSGSGNSGSGSQRVESSISWSRNASDYRDRFDQDFVFDCPPNGRPGRIWGTDVYTDDSSICTAAVHAGLIGTSSGGEVTLQMEPGQFDYEGSRRNGITSSDFGQWDGSFRFVREASDVNNRFGWRDRAADLSLDQGEEGTVRCPENGQLASIWGTDVYTMGSSVCTAAVHAGFITQRRGGDVTIRVISGQPGYVESDRNGVESNEQGRRNFSFIIVE